MAVQHPIQLAAKRAGLTPFLIRAWEKRYDAVSPDRTDTNRRLYSEDEIERLRLLGVLTRGGHRIGDIARLPTSSLAQLSTELSAPVASPSLSNFSAQGALEEAIAAIADMNAAELDAIAARSAVALGQHGLLERFISPLARRIGELWTEGTMSAAHEHLATDVLREFLLRGTRASSTGANAPAILITTPTGQLHELGAAITAAAASDLGWRIVYLGPNLPAVDIAHAAVKHSVRAVALSIVYPADDGELAADLTLLRRLLPKDKPLIMGGAAASAYKDLVPVEGVFVMDNLSEFSRHLTRLRTVLRQLV